MKASERGAALLSVLLLVAVMAVLAAASLEKLKLATRLAGNGAAIDQARAYALAGESVALYRIGDLIQRDSEKTTLEGGWEGRELPLPIDGGIATVRLRDGGNCFNLNSLVVGDDARGFIPRPQGTAQFERLMTLLGIPPSDARSVALAASDWIDSDSFPQPGGVEDAAYARFDPPYRTANVLMVDRSELRAVAGVTPRLYARIAPFLCALPVPDLSLLNVNTLAPGEAVLLASVVPGLDIAGAERIIADRSRQGFFPSERFTQHPVLVAAGGASPAQTGFETRWFELRLLIELGGAELEENALIDARLKPGKLVRRVYGEAA